jgi:hypothetical protein
MVKSKLSGVAAATVLLLGAPAFAQISQVDPNSSYQAESWPNDGPADDSGYQPVDPGSQDPVAPAAAPAQPLQPAPSPAGPAQPAQPGQPVPLTAPSDTIPREDIFSAAEGVFGQGAQGLAELIEKILKDQGEPTAYIAGQEAGGAFVFGLRYGSGTMRHRIEGDRAVYWTGPSIGFDAGADASKVFVLVYNLHDSQDLFKRYPAAEGNAYAVGGFTASYLRRGDVVLIPVRLGVGLRLGVNAGYMKFSEKTKWMPF